MHKVFPKNFHTLFINNLLTLVKNNHYSYTKKEYEKNQIIFVANDTCSKIGLILSGHVTIEQFLLNGNKNIINHLNPYDVFGEILIFSDEPYYPYHIVARSKCEILFISKEILFKIFKEDMNLLEGYLCHISQSHMNLNQFIKLNSQKTILRKLAFYFLYYGNINPQQLVCKIDTKTQLAQFIGVERQSLIRELNHLKAENLLDFDRKNIYIKDFAYFKHLIE